MIERTGATDRHRAASEDGIADQPQGLQSDGLSVLRVCSVILRHWRLMVLLPITFALVALAISLLRERTFSTTVAFVPQGSQSAQSQLSGLASQFGVSLSGGDNASQSPRFYESLLKTNDILGAVADSTYQYEEDGHRVRGTLAELLGAEGRSPEVRRSHTIKKLKERLSTSTDKETGIVRITVQTPWASVSQQLALRLLGLVNNFNLLQRQHQAAAERDFVEGRLSDARGQLRQSEDELQFFLQRNRQYAGDPGLMATHDRLERAVALRQQVYASLAQMYEQASLTVMRNTPLIAVVEQPQRAAEADPRGAVSKAILAFVFGVIVAVIIAFMHSVSARTRDEAPQEFAEVLGLYHGVRNDIQRLWPWRARG